MIFNTTRRHEIWFQKVSVLKIIEIFAKSLRISTMCGVIQNVGWTHMEYTSKIILVRIENNSFGCNWIFEIWISERSGHAIWGLSDFQILHFGRDCFARFLTLEESASHHYSKFDDKCWDWYLKEHMCKSPPSELDQMFCNITEHNWTSIICNSSNEWQIADMAWHCQM